MRSRLLSLIVVGLGLLVPSGRAAAGAGPVELGPDLRLPLPSGWAVVGESPDYPFQIVNEERTAELLVYRSVIEADEQIADEGELREAVDLALEEVIFDLPEVVLLTSTGYYRGNHAAFALDFLAEDSVLGVGLQHRLVCLVYGHPEGYQLMFTLWAKTAAADAAEVYGDLVLMQDGFRYVGPARSDVFERGPGRGTWLLVAAVPAAVLVLLRLRRDRVRSNRAESAQEKRRPTGDAVR